MIAQKLQATAAELPDRVAVVDATGISRYRSLEEMRIRFSSSWQALRGARVALAAHSSAESIAGLAALDELGCHVYLSGSRTAAGREQLAHEFQLGFSVFATDDGLRAESHSSPAEAALAQSGCVTILTSGTTGKPKAANHLWSTLARPARVQDQFDGSVWMLTYPLQLYAGLQVFLQALFNRATLVIPKSNSPSDVAAALRDHQVQYVSGTPSFWRNLLLFAPPDDLRTIPLRQVTMGGEAAPQDLLDRCASTFPQARIVHVYATTETGRCFSVTDGRSGFPARYLDQPSEDGVSMRIRDGMLEVRSANAMHGYDRHSSVQGDAQDWFPTGDLVRQEGDRVHFLGRQSDLINVGGHKVFPVKVEDFLRTLDGIEAVRVYGKKNPITGEIVAAEVVLASGATERETRNRIATAASVGLQSFERPRLLQFVPRIEVSASGKVTRRES